MQKMDALWITFVAFLLLLVNGVVSDVVSQVFVMAGGSVTLKTGVEINQEENIVWYIQDNRLAQISADEIKICADDECKERFEERLKVDHQTASLTITNTTTGDSGLYKKVTVYRNGTVIKMGFNVTVQGVSAERVEMKRESVKEGDSVTLDSGGIKNPSESLQWYFDKTLIAEITGDQSQICTGDECKERFRDRLKVDHQTGSLTITNTRTEDSGEYHLLILRISSSRVKSYSVDVTAAGLSSAVVGGCVFVTLLILLVAPGLIYYKCRNRRKERDIERQASYVQVSAHQLQSSTQTNSQQDKGPNLESCDMGNHQSDKPTDSPASTPNGLQSENDTDGMFPSSSEPSKVVSL